ncbi:MAG: J domain-containing protein [Pseudomonadota bacterium]
MYIARHRRNRSLCYFIRRSLQVGGQYIHQELMSLGPDPARFVIYPGGNAFYIDETISQALKALEDQSISVDSDTLEALFWPFIRPDIKRAVETFSSRTTGSGKPGRLNPQEIETIRLNVPAFDKRRLHYLKFGKMDQGPVAGMPPVLFRNLTGKSRDELEQMFMTQEQNLEASEYKSYVYAAFNLQQFFSGFLAKGMPQAMDPERVDACFLDELCHINQVLFNAKKDAGLHDYLVRYLIMFFDHDYAHSTVLDDFTRDFMARHRGFRPPGAGKVMTNATALGLLNLTKAEFDALNRRGLIGHYRKMARTLHPDTGGDHETFVHMAEAFQSLLKQKP